MADLNPYQDPGPFGRATIGGTLVPGVIRSINGSEKPEEIAIQAGTSSSNAVTVWKRTKLAESIVLVIDLATPAAHDAYMALRRVLRPKLGTKPPSLSIVNATINGNGVTKVVCRDAPMPKWITPGGYWQATIDLAEQSPPRPAKSGVVNNASNTASGNVPTQGEIMLQELLNQASKL